MAAFPQRTLGATGRRVGAIGLGSSYGLSGRDVERAFERGIDFFLWGSLRRGDFGSGLREVARKDRARATIAIQTYSRAAWAIPGSLERALRYLRTDYVDFLGLAWWQSPPPPRIVERALRLRDEGKVRHLMISCHERPTFARLIDDGRYEALMVRYNAAHPGPEREVFPYVAAAPKRPGVIAFTATRWGTLLDPRVVPGGERVPGAGDCYRFALSHRDVDMCLSGPANAAQLDDALAAMDAGPMSDEELAWMRRVGAAVRDGARRRPRGTMVRLLDWFSTLGKRKQLMAGS